MSPERLLRACRAVAAVDTAYPPMAHLWAPQDPLAEHCGAVAYVMAVLLGGEVWSGRDQDGQRWLFNRLPDGTLRCFANPGAPVPARRRRARLTAKRFDVFLARVRDHLDS